MIEKIIIMKIINKVFQLFGRNLNVCCHKNSKNLQMIITIKNETF
jgi:hypothetical protein